jgi:chitodextrinase
MTPTPPLFTRALPLLLITILCGSSLLSAQGRDRTPPTAPTNLQASNVTETSVSLSWGPSTDNSGKFEYYISGHGPQVKVPQTSTSHTMTGLTPGTTYTFKVAARDFSGNSSKSSNAVTVTMLGVIPGAPTKPVVGLLEAGPTHVALTWSATDDGPVIFYDIFIDGRIVGSTHLRSGTFTCANVMVPTYCVPFDQSSTYSVTVRARDNQSKYSPFSDPLLVTTAPANPDDLSPPTSPSNVVVDSDGGFLLVSWSASTDDFAPASLIRYDIYVDGFLRRVVVGETFAEVDFYFEEQNVTIIAVDTADHESEPVTVPIHF